MLETDCGTAARRALGETDGLICDAAALTIHVWLSQGCGAPAALEPTSVREDLASPKLRHESCSRRFAASIL